MQQSKLGENNVNIGSPRKQKQWNRYLTNTIIAQLVDSICNMSLSQLQMVFDDIDSDDETPLMIACGAPDDSGLQAVKIFLTAYDKLSQQLLDAQNSNDIDNCSINKIKNVINLFAVNATTYLGDNAFKRAKLAQNEKILECLCKYCADNRQLNINVDKMLVKS